jgi:spermidine synthase
LRKNSGVLLHKSYADDHFLEIRDNGNHRSLYFDSGYLQGQMSLSTPENLVISYTWYMIAALLLVPEPQKILVMGIGAGSFIRFFQHHFPNCAIDGVDNSASVIKAAEKFFHISQSKNLTIFCDDGYRFLEKTHENNYDIILVDAFNAKGMAPTIYNAPCLKRMAEKLSPEGILSCNLWSSDVAKLRQIKSLLAYQFQGTLYLPVPDRANIVCLAMASEISWSRICGKKEDLKKHTRTYGFNLAKIVQVAKQNNFTFAQKIASALKPFQRK